jgi:hypothetical protein
MRVDLHIDRLVLYGFAESDGPSVAAALRTRLAELVSTDPPQWTGVGRIDAGQFTPGPSAEHTGATAAASVHKGLLGASRS